MSDSTGAPAVLSPAMAQILLLSTYDDGSPLPVQRLNASGGTARLRVISGLQSRLEGLDLGRQEAARILRTAHARFWWERRDERRLKIARAMAAEPFTRTPKLDVVRIRWSPAEGLLRLSNWARAEDGSRASDWGGDRFQRHGVIRAETAQQNLWRDHRLNLGALRAFLDAMHTFGLPDRFGALLEQSREWAALTVQEEFSCFNDGDMISGDEAYYSFDAVQEILAHVVRDNPKGFPWHKGAKGQEMSIGLRFDSQGGDGALLLFFDGGDVQPQYMLPFQGSDKTVRAKIQKINRLRREISETTEKLRDKALEFRKAVASDQNAAARIDRLIVDSEEQIKRKRQEVADAYAETLAMISPHKETLLSTAREREGKMKAYAQAKTVTSEIRPNFTRTSPYFSQLSPHLTAVPVDFLFSDINPKTGKLQVSHMALDKAGRERQLTLDLYERGGPGGFQDFMQASRAVIGNELSWMPFYTLVALHHNPGEMRLIDKDQKAFLLDCGEFFRTTHANEVDDISRRGLSDWFKRKYPSADVGPVDALVRSIQFLSGVSLSVGDNADAGEIGGLLFYQGRLPTRTKGRAEILYTRNLLLSELEAGTDQHKPFYMYTNSRALFSCKSQMRGTVPSLQIYLESLTRAAALGGGKRMETEGGHILVGRSPQGDEMTLGTLIEAIGLYGKRRGDLFARVDRALGTLEDLGVVASRKYKGSKADPFTCKVELAMSKDYNGLYSVSRMEDEIRAIDQHLIQNPLKPLDVRIGARRGRPPKRPPAK